MLLRLILPYSVSAIGRNGLTPYCSAHSLLSGPSWAVPVQGEPLQTSSRQRLVAPDCHAEPCIEHWRLWSVQTNSRVMAEPLMVAGTAADGRIKDYYSPFGQV